MNPSNALGDDVLDPVTDGAHIIMDVWGPLLEPGPAIKATYSPCKVVIHRLYIDMTSMVHRSATLEQHSDAPMHIQTLLRLARSRAIAQKLSFEPKNVDCV